MKTPYPKIGYIIQLIHSQTKLELNHIYSIFCNEELSICFCNIPFDVNNATGFKQEIYISFGDNCFMAQMCYLNDGIHFPFYFEEETFSNEEELFKMIEKTVNSKDFNNLNIERLKEWNSLSLV